MADDTSSSPPSAADGSSRFSPISETDHAGYLWIVTILGITYTGLSCALRAWIKRGLYGWDDALLAAATAAHYVQAVPVFTGLSHGLGQFNSITAPDDWAASGKSLLAAELLSLLVLGLCKGSVFAMMMRVFSPDADFTRGWKTCFGCLVFSLVWTFGSMIAVVANCDAVTLVTPRNIQECPGQLIRWQVIVAIDILTDIMICLLPPILTWRLNMSRRFRFQVVLAFSFRIFLVPLSILQVVYLAPYTTSTEPQFAIIDSLLFQQTLLTVSLITATIPNLKTFMKSFDIGFGLPMGNSSSDGSRGYALRTIGGSWVRAAGAATASSRDREPRPSVTRPRHRSLRPDAVQHEVTVSHVDRMSDTTDGNSLRRAGSQDRIIITREVEWNISHERCI